MSLKYCMDLYMALVLYAKPEPYHAYDDMGSPAVVNTAEI